MTRFDRVLCLQLWFEQGEFWRAYSPYSVLLLQKREESNWNKGKVVSSLRQKCRQKTPEPELIRLIPWWWFFKDAHHSDRPSKIDDDEMKALVQANKHSMVRELATTLKVSVGSVHGHLKSLGFVKKLDVWVPHELKEIHLTNRAWASAINSSNAKKTIRSWSVWSRATKNGLFTTMSAEKEVGVREVKYRKDKQRRRFKRRLSMWWDWKGPVFYELLPKNKTINSDEQLQKLRCHRTETSRANQSWGCNVSPR